MVLLRRNLVSFALSKVDVFALIREIITRTYRREMLNIRRNVERIATIPVRVSIYTSIYIAKNLYICHIQSVLWRSNKFVFIRWWSRERSPSVSCDSHSLASRAQSHRRRTCQIESGLVGRDFVPGSQAHRDRRDSAYHVQGMVAHLVG